MIDDDEQFEEAENWMSECQEKFLRQEIKANCIRIVWLRRKRN